jgi:diguanylate cyclase (GGDEF)-like protein
MSSTIRDMFRETDMFARFGGEEFIAILPETDIFGASTLAEKIRATLEATPIIIDDETTLYKTASIGAAESDADDVDFSRVVGRSDEALYEAKEGGRNRICTSPSVDMKRLSDDGDLQRRPILKAIDL